MSSRHISYDIHMNRQRHKHSSDFWDSALYPPRRRSLTSCLCSLHSNSILQNYEQSLCDILARDIGLRFCQVWQLIEVFLTSSRIHVCHTWILSVYTILQAKRISKKYIKRQVLPTFLNYMKAQITVTILSYTK